MSSSPVARRLLPLLYLAGILVAGDQLADLTATLLAKPFAVGEASWRFGAFGLLTTRASVFLVADVMLFAAALGLGHRGVLRVMGAVHVAIALALLAGVIGFTLDWLQVRRQVPATGVRSFDLAWGRGASLAALALVLVSWAARAAWRASRPHQRRGPETLLTDVRQDEARP